MILNLERLEVYTDIAHEECVVMDVRKEFANIIYKNGNGMDAHSLAHKIYENTGEVEYNDDEIILIKEYASKCTPAFIDAINFAINKTLNNAQ